MSAQPAFEAHFPEGRGLVWEDLQSIPDDQYWRYQLIEGELLVSPAPDARHQSVVVSLAVLLRATCPPHLKVLVAPFDVTPRPGWSLQPDVLVLERATMQRARAVVPPVLAVEVLSPSSRTIDRTLKRAAYEDFGVASYWVVDPLGPSVTVLELAGGRYVERASVRDDATVRVDAPFPCTLVPADLLDE